MTVDEMKPQKPESYWNLAPVVMAAIAFVAVLFAIEKIGQSPEAAKQPSETQSTDVVAIRQ